MKKINEILKYREKLKKEYIKQLLPLIQKSIIKIPSTSKKNRSGLYNFPIIINSKDKNTRNKLAEHLQQNRIFTAIHYTPAHTHSFYKKKFKSIKLPVTNYIFDRILSLPFHSGIKTRDVKIVSKNISNFFMNKI